MAFLINVELAYLIKIELASLIKIELAYLIKVDWAPTKTTKLVRFNKQHQAFFVNLKRTTLLYGSGDQLANHRASSIELPAKEIKESMTLKPLIWLPWLGLRRVLH